MTLRRLLFCEDDSLRLTYGPCTMLTLLLLSVFNVGLKITQSIFKNKLIGI
jgi:hypothetical protein